MTIDLNIWHHAIHQVTGGMAVKFNRATAADLEQWAMALRKVADEMQVTARDEPPASCKPRRRSARHPNPIAREQ